MGLRGADGDAVRLQNEPGPGEGTTAERAAIATGVTSESGGQHSGEHPAPLTQAAAPSALASPAVFGDATADLVGLEARGGIIARTVTLSGLIVASLVIWAQLSFRSKWVTAFLQKNDLDADLRMRLIWSIVAGVLLGAAIGAVVLFLAARRGHPLAAVERMAWFLSPLILLPWLPILFRYKPWKDRQTELLPAVLVAALMAEVLFRRALVSVPEIVRRTWARARERAPALWRRHGPLLVVVALAVFYVALMSFYHLRLHYKLKTANFDLSINNNLLYGGLEGVFMHSPVAHGDDPAKYLAAHAKYGGYLFLPLYALYPKPEFLIVLQSTLLGLGAIPLFAFARKRISQWAAAAVAVAYLCYHPMHNASFHETNWIPVGAFFVIATVWAVDARRWVLCSLFFSIGILIREDMPIGFAVIGAVLLLSGHRPLPGLLMALVASIWFVIVRFFIMESAGEWWFPNMYKELWAPGETGLRSVVKTLISNPVFVLGKLVEEKKVYYLLHLLVPLAFLPARRWYLVAAFIPGALLTLLVTDYEPIYSYTFHYVMHWTPYLFLATPLALAAIVRSGDLGVPRMRAAVCAMLFACFALTYNYGAFPARTGSVRGGYFAIDFSPPTDRERLRYQQLKELSALIPPHASVATTENVGPHLSSRKDFYSLRQGPHGAEWILASNRELNLDNTKVNFKSVVESGQYGVVRRLADMAVLKRGYNTAHNQQLLTDWGLL